MGPAVAQMETGSSLFPQFLQTRLTPACPYQKWHYSDFQTAQSSLETHQTQLHICFRYRNTRKLTNNVQLPS